MKFVFRFAILGVVLLIVAHYVSPQLPDNPLINWLASAEKTATTIINKNTSSDVSPVKVSKWTDAKGVIHYENRPVDGAKTMEVDPNVNVLPSAPAVKLPDAKDEKPKSMNEEVQALQNAKDAYTESIINN